MGRPAAPNSRKAARQQDQRLRREQREERREIDERAQRQAVPRRDDGPSPRID